MDMVPIVSELWKGLEDKLMDTIKALLPSLILFGRQRLPVPRGFLERCLQRRCMRFDVQTATVLAQVFPALLSLGVNGENGGEYHLSFCDNFREKLYRLSKQSNENELCHREVLIEGFRAAFNAYVREHSTDPIPPLWKEDALDARLLTPLASDAEEAKNISTDPRTTVEMNHEPINYKDNLTEDATCDSHTEAELRRSKISSFFDEIKCNKDYDEQIIFLKEFDEVKAKLCSLESLITSKSILEVLKSMGIRSLYTHQKDAVEASMKRENVMIATPTGSGKSLCYLIPIISELLGNTNSRVLVLYPTKALANDQLSNIRKYLEKWNLENTVNCYDGDTPYRKRKDIQANCRIFLTNADTLHYSILPSHKRSKWGEFVLKNLSTIVIDECHTYTGTFGTHVSLILRRLRRICNYYGSHPNFITCSASIANPLDHALRLTGETLFHLVEESGASQGFKTFAIWNPSSKISSPSRGSTAVADMMKTKNKKRSLRGADGLPSESSPHYNETAFLLAELVKRKLRVLIFVKYRAEEEELLQVSRSYLPKKLWSQVATYRGGYSIQTRRQLESKLKSGDILAMITTNALELGIDIPKMDAVIVMGFPVGINNLWQQVGRAGRDSSSAAVSVLVLKPNALDQQFVKSPELVFSLRFPNCVIDPLNTPLLLAHLKCSIYELPYTKIRSEKVLGSVFPSKLSFEEHNESAEDANRALPVSQYFDEVAWSLLQLLCSRSEHLVEFRIYLERYKKMVNPFAYQDKSMFSANGVVLPAFGEIHYIGVTDPCKKINLRNIESELISVIDNHTGTVLETFEVPTAYARVHPGAVYFSQGDSYAVMDLNLSKHIAVAQRCNIEYKTQCRRRFYFATLNQYAKHLFDNRDAPTGGEGSDNARCHDNGSVGTENRKCTTSRQKWNGVICEGRIRVTERIDGYWKRYHFGRRAEEFVELRLPEITYSPAAVWMQLPEEVQQCDYWEEGLHALEHALLSAIPLTVPCDSHDVSIQHLRRSRDVFTDCILLFENNENGIGLCHEIAQSLPKLLRVAGKIIRNCTCSSIGGCIQCTQYTSCTENNNGLNKSVAAKIFEILFSI